MPSKKNGGIVPPVTDERVRYVPVGCGKCMECKKQKSRNWQVRLHEEVRQNKNGKFVTLTFSNESIAELRKTIKGLKGYELDNEIATKATRRFLERWRKKHGRSVRHWLVTELGQTGTENIHLHGIIWTDKPTEDIEERWGYGHVWIGDYVNEKTINYIVKYINKTDVLHKEYNSKILTSAGIGRGYIERQDAKYNKYKEDGETKETYTTRTGLKIALPIYYRNQIYNDEEKEKLWIKKLDQQKRYVGGEEVCIKDGEEKYYQILEYYRKINQRLGYGNNKIDWDKRKYENERRNLNIKKRIQNAYSKKNKKTN